MQKLSLNGTWQMKCVQEDKWIPAEVPGSVYQNLLEAGEIQDPFYRENEPAAKEVSEKDYIYRRKFTADHAILKKDRILLICEGIDTIAEIFVNDERVLFCNNMHRTWEADVKSVLREGENEICVKFTSPYAHLSEIKAKHPDMDLEGHLFQAHLQMRKAAYMFGWDWGPALADMGIWKPVAICGWDKGRISRLKINQKHYFEKAVLECEAERELYSRDTFCRFSVYDPEGNLLSQKETEDGKVSFEIKNPRLWWCRGYGDQPLYRVRVELIYRDEIVDDAEKKIGIRTLTVCQDKDRWGSSFYFKINGVEVFARGADYIPEDSLLGRVNKERSRRLLNSCLNANFNTIRVWGGGVYPTDEFLKYCDEKGLMVWQDFMFANIVSIWSGEEKRNMEEEIIWQTRRFREHPCIALLCGNNETEMMIWEEMEPRFKEMYIRQYEVDMPAIIKKEAPDIFYWPSSPSSFGRMKDTENENYGDSHDWNVWHGEKPFTYYRTTFPRFNSEFGLQSFPCMKTIETFTKPEDRNIFSYVMENHQKSKSGNRVINSYISQYFKFPVNFKALLYLSQMIQMEGIRYGVEHWRRNRNERRCMGTLFWQVNDCWQVASWASIDCFGRWKALQYGAKRFYAPVLVSACEEGDTVELHISNETLVESAGTLSWKLFHVEKGLVQEDKVSCQVQRLHSQKICSLNFEEYFKTIQDRREYYFSYEYVSGGETVGEGTVLFVPAKHFEFKEPHIKCCQIDECRWELTTDHFAKFVEIELGGDVILSDNYFDLIPGQKKIIRVEEQLSFNESVVQMHESPEIYSLFNSFS